MLFYFVARLLAQPGGVGSYFCLVRCLSGGLVVLLELVIPPLSEKKKKRFDFWFAWVRGSHFNRSEHSDMLMELAFWIQSISCSGISIWLLVGVGADFLPLPFNFNVLLRLTFLLGAPLFSTLCFQNSFWGCRHVLSPQVLSHP
jgi:hypothetical protein